MTQQIKKTTTTVTEEFVDVSKKTYGSYFYSINIENDELISYNSTSTTADYYNNISKISNNDARDCGSISRFNHKCREE